MKPRRSVPGALLATCLAMAACVSTPSPHEPGLPDASARPLPPLTLVPQLGHDQLIIDVQTSPTGRLVATLTADGAVRVQDMEARVLLARFEPLRATPPSGLPRGHLAFSPDGNLLASWSPDEPLALYDLARMERVRTLEVAERVLALRFERGGELTALTSTDEGAWLRRLDGGQDISFGAPATAGALSPTGGMVALARASGIDLIALEQPTLPTRTLSAQHPHLLRFSPDGRALASVGLDLLTWDTTTGEPLNAAASGVCSTVTFSPDSVNATVGCEGRLWTFALRTNERVVGRTPGNVLGVAYTASGRELVVARGADLFVVDTAVVASTDRADPLAWPLLHFRAALPLQIVAERGRVAVSDSTALSVWDMDELRVAARFGSDDKVMRVEVPALGSGGRVAVAVAADWCSASSIPSTLITACGQPGQERGRSGVVTLDTETGTVRTTPLGDALTKKGWPVASAVSADGDRIAIALQPSFTRDPTTVLVLDGANGKVLTTLTSEVVVSALHLSADGKVLALGTADGRFGAVALPRASGALALPPLLSGRVHTLVSAGQELLVAAGDDLRVAVVDAGTGALRRTLTASQPVVTAAPGPDGTITALDRTGTVIHWDEHGAVQHERALAPPPARGARIEPGTGVLLAPSRGLLRATRLDSAEGVWLMSDPRHWLVWSDDGFFDGSRGASHLAAAVRGDRVYALDALLTGFNRPDLLLTRMGRGSEALRARYARKHARRLEKQGVREEELEGLYRDAPEVRIASWREEDGQVTLDLSIHSREALERYELWIDGVPVHGVEGRPVSGTSAEVTERVELMGRDGIIEVSATNRRGIESPRATLHVGRTGGSGGRRAGGVLHYVGLGVSSYEDHRLDLGFAAKDVRDLGTLLAKASAEARVHVLTDDEVTRDGFEAVTDLLAHVAPEDTVVLFLAGHGAHDPKGDAYYFIAHETDLEHLEETAISFQRIERLIASTPARQRLIILDTCQSGDDGQGDEPAPPPAGLSRSIRGFLRPKGSTPAPTAEVRYDLQRLIEGDAFRRSGAVVLSSSRGSEASYEFKALSNGVFTYSLKAALTTERADQDGDGWLSPRELEAFLLTEVAARTEGKQHPTVDRDNPFSRVGLPRVR